VKPEEVREVLVDALRYALSLIPDAPWDPRLVDGISVYPMPVATVHYRFEESSGVRVDADVSYVRRGVKFTHVFVYCSEWVEFRLLEVYGRSYAEIAQHYGIEDLFTWDEDRLTSEMREEKEKFVRFVECWRRFRSPADQSGG